LTVAITSSTTKAVPPASVTIPAGATSTTFTITTAATGYNIVATIGATLNGQTVTATLGVNAAHALSINLSPNSLIGGTSSSGFVQIAVVAPVGGTVVTLSSNNTAATLPASVTVPAGQTAVLFTVNTTAVSANVIATITGTLAGGASNTANLTIKAPTLVSVAVSPSTVQGSSSTVVTGTVTISGPAPVGGLVITLASSNPSAASTPATVTIPAGQTSATFTVTQSAVTTQTAVTITATLGTGSVTTTLTVTP
jgi:hypothetical protein